MKTHGLIYTVGHSNLECDDFMHILKCHDIKLLVDIRSHPTSSKVPWASQKNLSGKLGNAYSWLSELGGPTAGPYSTQKFPKDHIGRVRPEFKNIPEEQRPKTWWNQGLFDFDVWMGSNLTFQDGLHKLQKLRDHWHNVAIMCAEVLYWKCHRSMISDAWVAMGGQAKHIMNAKKIVDHPLGDRLERYTEQTKGLWTTRSN